MSDRAPAIRRAPIASAQHGLRLLGPSLNREVLLALAAQGPMSLSDLVSWLVASSRTNVAERLEELIEAGAVVGERRGGVRMLALSRSGQALVEVIELVADWLPSHPNRPLAPFSPLGWRAFGAVAAGWQAGILEWIVRSPPTPAEAPGGLPGLSKRRLKGELDKLIGADAVELCEVSGRPPRYRLTDWGRRVFGVLVAIARWEAVFLRERAVPLELDDAIVALLATLPLTSLPKRFSGTCSLSVELDPGVRSTPRAGAVWAAVSDGRVAACGEGRAPEQPVAWVSGTFGAWFAAVLDRRTEGLRMGGTGSDREVARTLVDQLHVQLYGYRQTADL